MIYRDLTIKSFRRMNSGDGQAEGMCSIKGFIIIMKIFL